MTARLIDGSLVYDKALGDYENGLITRREFELIRRYLESVPTVEVYNEEKG